MALDNELDARERAQKRPESGASASTEDKHERIRERLRALGRREVLGKIPARWVGTDSGLYLANSAGKFIPAFKIQALPGGSLYLTDGRAIPASVKLKATTFPEAQEEALRILLDAHRIFVASLKAALDELHPYTPPRYDEVFAAGTAALDADALDADGG